MVRPFVFALLPLGLLACSDSEGETTESNPVFLSLDGKEDSSKGDAAASPGAEDSGTTEASLDPKGQSQGNPQPASSALVTDTAAALESLANWHRAPTASRSMVLRDPSAAVAGIRSLARVWNGEADAYKASLRTSSEGAFGEEFAQYASAWTKEGKKGLQQALAQGPVGSVSHLVWTDVLVEVSLAKDDYRTGGVALSTLLNGMLESGYARERILELVPRIALVGRNASTFLPVEDYEVQSGDSYWVICRAFRKKGILVNQGWIADFNHKRNYNLRQGETLRIPTSKLSVLAWRGKRLMALYADGVPIRLFPVSMGRTDAPTPLGSFTLDICEKEPVYYPPGASPVPYGNPENPLGERWLGFLEDRQYGIHGNNSEETIGSYESGGCIRMRNQDVVEMFEFLCAGIPVTISA